MSLVNVTSSDAPCAAETAGIASTATARTVIHVNFLLAMRPPLTTGKRTTHSTAHSLDDPRQPCQEIKYRRERCCVLNPDTPPWTPPWAVRQRAIAPSRGLGCPILRHKLRQRDGECRGTARDVTKDRARSAGSSTVRRTAIRSRNASMPGCPTRLARWLTPARDLTLAHRHSRYTEARDSGGRSRYRNRRRTGLESRNPHNRAGCARGGALACPTTRTGAG